MMTVLVIVGLGFLAVGGLMTLVVMGIGALAPRDDA